MISNSLNILSISSYNHIIFSGVVMCWCREVREREKMEKGDPGCYEVVAGSRVGAGLSRLESRFSSCRDVGQRSPELSMADTRTQIVS